MKESRKAYGKEHSRQKGPYRQRPVGGKELLIHGIKRGKSFSWRVMREMAKSHVSEK